ncbi:alpha-L-rhamnosidase [Formosa sp. PL04]|uniref:alpha-L-rhamnosidase n=1 Tax=Formosa sp. PL04 TaxID=3081755 RepID=UPI002981E7C8|nr:family 78 glycoside hydrolase catalytic domain [Formosa sp. PL04]MDW5288119.1 family 78 glycoside hydrolase catalytic domain [Formosa sp. PL04]
MKSIQKLAFLNVLLIICSSSSSAFAQHIKVDDLVTEYHKNPIGIDVEKPRLSWKLVSETYDVIQTAYEIRVSNAESGLEKEKELIWSSGKIESDQSTNISYEGRDLNSSERVYWQVRVWDNKNKTSAWSAVSFWEMGVLNQNVWKADWITMKGEEKSKTSLPSQYYRKDFSVSKDVSSARVYVTSLGLYHMFINGEKVGDQEFTPGFTSYKKRIQYQTYDVTKMLKKDNAIGAIVGDGWYRGYLGWDGLRSYYGDTLGLFAQLHVNYKDGTSETITTNDTWKSSYGPIQKSDIYNGETYDARLEMTGWATANFDDSKWKQTTVLNHSKDILVASNGLPVKITQEIKPVKTITTPTGELVFDLGQNIVGWAQIKVQGKKGDTITLKFAEVLDKEGNFFTKNLRAAEATDRFILKGDDVEVFQPHFTFHGFRFIKVEGATPVANDIIGMVIHSDMKETGTFTTSDPLINQLQSNIQWGQRDNFLDIPTDCPQRDERVGWTGDTQVFSMTAGFNFNVASFYTKWLKDLALDQQPNGEVPNVIPDMWNNKMGGTTGWADAAVIVPWSVYQTYGDTRVLEEQYESMKGWIEYMKKNAGNNYLWDQDRWHWGDWLAFHSENPDYAGSVTEKDLIATAYFKYSTTLFSQIAEVLGHNEDAKTYAALAEKIKEAFIQEYITPNGRLMSHTQTAYALALSFDLVPENLIQKSADYFAADVEKFGHLTTGFLGTPLLCSTLSKIGRDDLAFMLLNRKEYPSWLYPVTQGATTIWERWDTQKPDGTIIDGMNSFNHYAYGAIGEWMYSHIAGLQIDSKNPGYKHTILSPHPGGGLTYAKAETESLYGTVASEWSIEKGVMTYKIVVPANTTATVILPNATSKNVAVNSEKGKMIKSVELIQRDTTSTTELGSGTYVFSYKMDSKK